METLLLALSLVAFRPCGFELAEDGQTRQILAPNLILTYINPLQVVEIVKIAYGREGGIVHEADCVKIVFAHGKARMVEGTIKEVRAKLRKGRENGDHRSDTD